MNEELLHGIVQKCVLPMRLGVTARDTLQEFIDIDVTADDLVRIFKQNPGYRQILEKFVSIKSPGVLENPDAEPGDKKDDKPARPTRLTSTHRLIALLGMLGTRNFILALRLHKATTGSFPSEVKGKWNFSPSEFLPRSSSIEELCQLHKFSYGEAAYAAAYMWDWTANIAKQSPAARALTPFIDQQWKIGLRTGLVCYKIAEAIPNFTYQKYAMAAGISHNIGKALLAIYTADSSSSYIDWLGKQDKIPNLPRLTHSLEEHGKYGVNYFEVSAMISRVFSVLSPIEKPLRFQIEPYYLKGVDKNLYQMAGVLQLAVSMGFFWRVPPDEKDPLLRQFKQPWVKDLRLNEKKLSDIMKVAMNLKT